MDKPLLARQIEHEVIISATQYWNKQTSKHTKAMNKRFLDRTLAIGLLIIGVISLSNCASDSRQKRIAKNPEIFGQLSQDHQSLVQQGQISQGMNKKAVYLAWGDPSRSSKGAAAGAQFEKWYY